MKALLIAVGTLGLMHFFGLEGKAQDFLWAHRIGNVPSMESYSELAIDGSGNIVTAGIFSGTTNIHPTGSLSLTSNGNLDCFVSRLYPAGNLIWGKQIGGTGFELVHDMIVDNSGSIYVCGIFDSPVLDADPGVGVYNLTGGNYQAFIVKLDSTGNFVWATSYGSTGSDVATDLELDYSGNLIVGGQFSGTVDFDASAATNSLTATVSGYVLKLNKNTGSFVSVYALGSMVHSIKTYGTNYIVVGGYFSGTMDLDPSAVVSNFTSTGVRNGFVAMISNLNAAYWIAPFNGSSYVSVENVMNLPTGNILVALQFNADIKMNPASSTITNTNGDYDVAIVKLDYLNGSFIWGNQYGGVFDDFYRAAAADTQGNLYLTLDYQQTIDADPGVGVDNYTSTGNRDFLLLRLELTSGTNSWAHSFGAAPNSDAAYSLVVDNDELLLGGSFGGVMDVNPGTGVNTLTATSVLDAFLLKITQCSTLYHNMTDFGCGSYTSPSGMFTWTTSGIYTDVLYSTTQSCDSIITCDITIINSDSTLNIFGDTMIANQSGASYQWIECITQTIISGETSQSFIPTVDGNYGVIINNGGCISTSDCYTFSGLSIEEKKNEFFKLFPNPANDLLEINSETILLKIQIFDLAGKLILEWNEVNSIHPVLDIQSLLNGSYLVKAESESGIQIEHFIKLK